MTRPTAAMRRSPQALPDRRRLPVGSGLLLGAALAGCTSTLPSDEAAGDAADLLDAVEVVEIDDRSHVDGPVDYDRVPPLGGPHAPIWANCGFYDDQVVPPEFAVHSMEHGAVWIAYPSTGAVELDALRQLTIGQPDLLVSPLPDLDGIVATAWGAQLDVDGPDDPALAAFIEQYVRGPQTPEPGAPCSGGAGAPS